MAATQFSREAAQGYLRANEISDLMNGILEGVAGDTPEEPLGYIIGMLEKMDDIKPALKCQLSEEWSPLTLDKIDEVNHNCKILKFRLPEPSRGLGLQVCACVLVRSTAEGDAPDVVRPYTPVSRGNQKGTVDLLIKVYPEGKMSQHLNTLKVGDTLDFKHIPFNRKIPLSVLRKEKHVVMLAAGTAITPMFQALLELFGDDCELQKKTSPMVTLLFGNRTEKDILLRKDIEEMAARCPKKFKIIHYLSTPHEEWKGERGMIDKKAIEAHCPKPSIKPKILVCGPPAMYKALCGPRGQPALSGALNELGYTEEMVFKF
uniref:NADH-cytochrome b5 reductase n=1 Tax=Lotharella globosa TaxID=91324 RepID=A0A7S4DX14_9EUKA